MKYLNVLMAVIFVWSLCPVHGQAPSSMAIYAAPDDLDLALAPAATAPKDGMLPLKASLKGLLGKLSAVEIRFTCSPDLRVVAPDHVPSQMDPASPVDLVVQVKAGSGKSPSGSWVKLHVTYLPDFGSLIKTVQEGADRYPEPTLREKLVKVIEGKRQGAVKANRVIGHRFLTPPFAGR